MWVSTSMVLILARHNIVSEHRYTNTQGLRDMGLGHDYCGEIDISVIAWSRSLGAGVPRSSWDGFRPLHTLCVSCCVLICVPCL